MKAEIDERIGGQMRMVFVGASEAHVLAKEIGTCSFRVNDLRLAHVKVI
jgi:hypothetical protein